jgi:VCBS repeat-containing protein
MWSNKVRLRGGVPMLADRESTWHDTTLDQGELNVDKSGKVSFKNPDIAEAINFLNAGDDVDEAALVEVAGNNCRCFNKGCKPV